jgi:hypothetical protein
MNAVIGGWVAGYSMSIVCTFSFTWRLVKAKGPSLVERFLGHGTPIGIAAIPLSIGLMYGWTMVGLVVGIVYHVAGFGDVGGLLGSPSMPMTAGSLVIGLLPLPFAVLTWPGWWWIHVTLSLSFVGLFGWAMPFMAAQ